MAYDTSDWPIIYRTTIDDRAMMTPEELDSLYRELRAYWAGNECGNVRFGAFRNRDLEREIRDGSDLSADTRGHQP